MGRNINNTLLHGCSKICEVSFPVDSNHSVSTHPEYLTYWMLVVTHIRFQTKPSKMVILIFSYTKYIDHLCSNNGTVGSEIAYVTVWSILIQKYLTYLAHVQSRRRTHTKALAKYICIIWLKWNCPNPWNRTRWWRSLEKTYFNESYVSTREGSSSGLV